METIQELRKQWKARRQEIYKDYQDTGDIRLVAEKHKITYQAAQRIIRKEEYAQKSQSEGAQGGI